MGSNALTGDRDYRYESEWRLTLGLNASRKDIARCQGTKLSKHTRLLFLLL